MCVNRQLLKCSVAFAAASWFCWSGGKFGDAGELSGLEAVEDKDGVPGWIDCAD